MTYSWGEVASFDKFCDLIQLGLIFPATSLLNLRAQVADSLDELLFVMMICADNRVSNQPTLQENKFMNVAMLLRLGIRLERIW